MNKDYNRALQFDKIQQFNYYYPKNNIKNVIETQKIKIIKEIKKSKIRFNFTRIVNKIIQAKKVFKKRKTLFQYSKYKIKKNINDENMKIKKFSSLKFF